jgi:hypothetical protein
VPHNELKTLFSKEVALILLKDVLQESPEWKDVALGSVPVGEEVLHEVVEAIWTREILMWC